MLSENQLKSLEILNNFIASTPKEEVRELVNKYANLEIDSPTMAEYLHILNNCDFVSPTVRMEDSSCIINAIVAPDIQKSILIYPNNPAFCGVIYL